MTGKDVIVKIKKLQALAADRGASEGEIANALAAISTLMARHGIEADALNEKPQVLHSKYEKASSFEGLLASAAALLYGCEIVFCGPTVSFVGRPENVEVAKITWQWLIEQVASLGKAGGANIPVSRGWVGDTNAGSLKWQDGRAKWRRDFCRACAARVLDRSGEVVRDHHSMAKTSGQTALVLENHFKTLARENEQFMIKVFGTLKSRRSRPIYQSAGSSAGWQAGDKVSLNKTVR